MLIRPATDADAPAVNALVTAVARERAYLGSTDGFTLEQTRGYFAQLARKLDGIFDDILLFGLLRHEWRAGPIKP